MKDSRRDLCLCLQFAGNQFSDPDQRLEKLSINIHVPFILGQIAFPMGPVEYSPLFRLKIQSVLVTLEDEVAIPVPL